MYTKYSRNINSQLTEILFLQHRTITYINSYYMNSIELEFKLLCEITIDILILTMY